MGAYICYGCHYVNVEVGAVFLVTVRQSPNSGLVCPSRPVVEADFLCRLRYEGR